jgi:AcrR family transcriptional regulator
MTDHGADPHASSTRDRLLLAAAELLQESTNRDVSTRAICERAGVQAPTLYHHFGNKHGLLDAVVDQRFTQFMQAAAVQDADAVTAIRAGWDSHLRFGLAHPSFYVLVHGEIQPGVPCTLTATAERLLVELFNEVALAGRLRVAPDVAATQLVAANVGATLRLVATPGEPDFGWATRLRESVLASVLEDAGTERPGGGTMSTLAVGFLAALDEDTAAFTDGERTLLREWLHRVAG